MRPSLVPSALDSLGGVATWAALSAATSASAVSRAVASGAVVQALPRVLALPGLLADSDARARAALRWAGAPAQVSHVTALRRYGLPVPDSEPADVVHLLVPDARRRRTTAAEHPVTVRLHRTRGASKAVWRNDLPMVSLERAVVQSWPLLTGSDQRAPAIVAVRRRLTTPKRLLDQLDITPGLAGTGDQRALLGLVADGCQSELEVWGYRDVFTGPRFAALVRQHPVVADGLTSVLDAFDEAAQLDIELDGRQCHDGPRDRERDLARDVRLAALGIQTIRFPHVRLLRDPEGCREEAWRVMQGRRAQLGR